jgi:hypothetical protein
MRGIVAMRGESSLSASDGGDKSRVEISVENAVPGGRHPWVLRTGQCGGGGSEIARVGDGNELRIGDDGKARAEKSVDLRYPSSGEYMIAILASAENAAQVIACGNFAPPTNR